MSAPVSRAAIERELLGWMNEPASTAARITPDAERFERIALTLFRLQFEACPPYARLCRSLDRTPQGVNRVEDIPAVPSGAFKEFDLRCYSADSTLKTFRTSGTSTDRRGQLHLDRLDLYEASLLSSLRRCFIPDLVGLTPEMRFLSPSADEAPDSSLSHMFDQLLRAEGSADSRFDLRAGELDVEQFGAAVRRAQDHDAPLVIAGTSFAFVHFLDSQTSGPNSDRWHLPKGSRIMETGGFKGRSRSVPREVLRADIARCFGLDERSIVNQYGMTELGSQFYDSTLVDPHGPRRKLSPPWARVRIVDAEASKDVAPGEVGMIVIHDLANTGSVAAIQTADIGHEVLDASGIAIGFDVLGREEGAEARGCSIATDVMLEASNSRSAP